MAADPPGGDRGSDRATFSPDGFWWWDGGQWRSAVSPDGRWRWDGAAWRPNAGAPAARPRGGGLLIGIVIFGGVLLLVVLLTLVVLATMSSQIANVFSNVAAALTGP